MGSGKSAVGKRLAADLGLRFFDSDREIENRSGVEIDFIFEKEGEAGFRRREEAMLAELTQQKGIVLATGGGAVVNANNRSALASNGTVVYLETTVAQQRTRVGDGENRPMIRQSDEVETRLSELMAERDPLYREIADMVVPTDKRHVATVAKDIARRLGKR